jgi:hypothetical protein
MGSCASSNQLLKVAMKTLLMMLMSVLIACVAEMHAGQPILTVSDRIICSREACSSIRNRDLLCLQPIRGAARPNGKQAGATNTKAESAQGTGSSIVFPCRSVIEEAYNTCLQSSPGLRNPGQQQGRSDGSTDVAPAKLVTRKPTSLQTK